MMQPAAKFTLRLLTIVLAVLIQPLFAATDFYVETEPSTNSFPLVAKGKAAPVYVNSDDFPGVLNVAAQLQNDIKRVSGKSPQLLRDEQPAGNAVVIVGTIGKSALIDQLVAENKINVDQVMGRWDTFALQTVEKPFPGVEQALVIFGSDKRGTIYGIYDLSTKLGVSPWHYWADVPVQLKPEVFIRSGFHSPGEPKVKYRGIFINDEAPALRNWAKDTFGDFNSEFYAKVYELILRNKGNYLWPAMWEPSAFYVDDPESARLADELGIVVATTHHEPMMRAHAEWDLFGEGPWNYETNTETLQEFWRGGIERMGDYESVVTLGMRGDGDEAMSEDTAVDLMRKIIADQRDIIAEVTGKPAEQTPQVWALYKEAQDYYDKGVRVPDDVILLLCDDNWGNVRILPKKEDLNRKGGFGIYYHFDFVGGPVSYRWINVTQIEKVWEQMNLSYQWGARDLWLVNVGDIKPMELPISFFLDFAWNPEAISAQDLSQYYVDWATQQFGARYAAEIADIVALQTKYNARRTPEMIEPTTYSINNYREADTIVDDYKQLVIRAKAVYDKLPKETKSAFYQLVLFPTEISSNLNEMYVAAGKNKLYGEQGRASANAYADKVKQLFNKDAELTDYYHTKLEKGKWNHMMSQTHIGYTNWNNPPVNKMPAVSYVHVNTEAGLGYNVERGSAKTSGNTFSTFDPINNQSYYLEVFNTGREKLNYSIAAKNDWIQLSSSGGAVQHDDKIFVTINWDKAPKQTTSGEIVLSGGDREVTIAVPIRNAMAVVNTGFLENNWIVAIEAGSYTKANSVDGLSWTVVPNLGRTESAVTIEPANSETRLPQQNAPSLEYEFTLLNDAELKIHSYLNPTLNYHKSEGLKFAIAIDNEAPQIINVHAEDVGADWDYPDWWNKTVTDHIRVKTSAHGNIAAGKHTLKIWMIDPGVVFQKFVIDAGGLLPSYLGPPQSVYLP